MGPILSTIGRRAGSAVGVALFAAALAWGATGQAQSAEGELSFTFVAVNEAPAIEAVKPTLVISGNGSFTQGSVSGGGGYIYFDDATDVPKKILSSGTWEAAEVVRWTPAKDGATVAHVHPGVLDLKVNLIPEQGDKIEGADLRINCNVGFAGINNADPDTGEALAEGYWLSLPEGVAFGPTTAVGTFSPKDPVLGLTVIGR